jgi:hypothetical protein
MAVFIRKPTQGVFFPFDVCFHWQKNVFDKFGAAALNYQLSAVLPVNVVGFYRTRIYICNEQLTASVAASKGRSVDNSGEVNIPG